MTSRAPDVAGAVIGWRVWRVEPRSRRPRLYSGMQNALWPAGTVTRARCSYLAHRPPATGCACGLYAVTDVGGVMGLDAEGGVLGLAALWGDVVEGGRGWRSSAGVPVLLLVDGSVREPTRQALAWSYGVPVIRTRMPLPVLAGAMQGRLRDDARALREEVARAASFGGTLDEASSAPLRRIADARGTSIDRPVGHGGPAGRRAPSAIEAARAAMRAVVIVVLGCIVPTLLGAWVGRSLAGGLDLAAAGVLGLTILLMGGLVVLTTGITSLSLEEGALDETLALGAGVVSGVAAAVVCTAAALGVAGAPGPWPGVVVGVTVVLGAAHGLFGATHVDVLSR